MLHNRAGLTPEQEIWGKFYSVLHAEVLKIKAAALTDSEAQSAAAVASQDKPSQPGDSTPGPAGLQVGS